MSAARRSPSIPLQGTLDIIGGASGPMTVAEVSAALGRDGSCGDEPVRHRLQTLVKLGRVVRRGNYPVRYELAPEGTPVGETAPAERAAVRIEERPDWLTDQVIADEVEAEKVWALAGVLRAANTAWGIDMGVDADVREARALIAEARRQVRENAPIGEHHREQALPYGEIGARQLEAGE